MRSGHIMQFISDNLACVTATSRHQVTPISCISYCWNAGLQQRNGLVTTGPRFNIKMTSYRYRKSHCGDKTVVRSSYLHNGISYTGKMISLYWIRALVSWPSLPIPAVETGIRWAPLTRLFELSSTFSKLSYGVCGNRTGTACILIKTHFINEINVIKVNTQ